MPLPAGGGAAARLDEDWVTTALSNLKPFADDVAAGAFCDEDAVADCVLVVEERVGNTLDEAVVFDKSVDELDKEVVFTVEVVGNVDLEPPDGAVVLGTLVEDDNDVVAVETAVRLPKFAANPAKPIGLFAEVWVLLWVIVGCKN